MAPTNNKNRKNYQDTKAKAKLREKYLNERKQQLIDAVKYCNDLQCRGKKAISSGMFPLIKDFRTINKALDVGIPENRSDTILTPDEEMLLAQYMKNKNRAGQGIKWKDVVKMVYDILTIRSKVNKKNKGGRVYIPLSKRAKDFLLTKKLSKSFRRKLEVRYGLTRKRQGTAAAQRVLTCTREMAEKHLDELAAECIRLGIFTEQEQLAPGVWTGKLDISRIYNHDEMPQFLNYGVDGQHGGLVFCGTGDKCSKFTKENRECVTIEPFISLAGDMDICHVIFPATCITSSMAPKETIDTIDNLLISTTQSGYQNHNTCLASHKLLKKVLDKKGVKMPIVSLTDGHSTRFDPLVMGFCRKSEINQFIGPPNTTSSTQVLDQMFAQLHKAYNEEKELLFDKAINRETFMLILKDIWYKWATPERIENAAKRCGISSRGFNVNDMDQEPFERAKLLLEPHNIPCTPSKSTQLQKVMKTPEGMRKDTKSYWKWKANAAIGYAHQLQKKPITPEEVVPELLSVRKVMPAMEKRRSVRATHVYGSMEGRQVYEVVMEKKKQEKLKEDRKRLKEDVKKDQLKCFNRCEIKCVCEKNTKCAASGLKKCQSCDHVLKSQCQQKSCLSEIGRKPNMLLPACNRKILTVKEVYGSEEEDSDDEENESDEELLNDSWDDDVNDDSDDDDKEVLTSKYVPIPFEDDIDIHSNEELYDLPKAKKAKIDFTGKKCTPLDKIRNIQKNLDDDQKNNYFAVYYDSTYYWGKALIMFSEDRESDVDEIKFTFLHPKVDGFWDWPKNPDEQIVPAKYMSFGPCIPSAPTRLGFRFMEDEEARKQYGHMKTLMKNISFI